MLFDGFIAQALDAKILIAVVIAITIAMIIWFWRM